MAALAAFGEIVDPGARLLVGGGVLVTTGLGQVVPHEALAFCVAQDAALTADGLGHEQALDARGVDHAGGVELHELHVDELRAGAVGEALAIARRLPRVGGHREGTPHATRREHDRLGREGHGRAVDAAIADGAVDAAALHRQAGDDDFLVDLRADGHAAILQGANELEAGAVADVRETRVGMAAERPLQDAAIAGAVEDGAPLLQLAHPVGRLLGVELGHARVVEPVATDHRVAEVRGPAVAVIDVGQRGGHAALGHDGVGLAQQRLAHDADREAGFDTGDGGAQAGATGADDEDVVWSGLDHRPRGSLR